MAGDDADGHQVYTVSEGRARVNGYGVDMPTSRRLTYAAVPDLRRIDTEVHTADAASTQSLSLIHIYGTYTITVTGLSIFAHDQFNFEGDAWLGYWNCNGKSYSLTEEDGYLPLCNSEFDIFREHYGFGNDFLVLSVPHPVEHFPRQSYEYKP